MAIPAVNSVVDHVMLVAERNRLFWRDPNLGDPRGADVKEGRDRKTKSENGCPEQTEVGNGVSPGPKDLRHVIPASIGLVGSSTVCSRIIEDTFAQSTVSVVH